MTGAEQKQVAAQSKEARTWKLLVACVETATTNPTMQREIFEAARDWGSARRDLAVAEVALLLEEIR